VDVERDETPAEKADRNWIELLQELRVAQTGIQILAGFLLTIPFSQRFGDMPDGYRKLYLACFGLAAIATGLLIAPVTFHRFLFGQHEKDVLVTVGDALAKVGLAALGLTLVAVVVLIFGFVMGTVTGLVAGGLMAAFFAVVWVLLPVRLLSRREHR
jgi:MFS family permease